MSNSKQAAIIGGGVIGGGWVARFALMGWQVNVFDPDPQAQRKIDEVLANAKASLPALYEASLPAMGEIRFCDSLADAVASASWVGEAVPERLELKQTVLAEVQQACLADEIIASSTSGFKPSELGASCQRPEQVIVAHPFNPVYLIPLVELVGAAETTVRARQVIEELGMFGLVVRKEIDAHIADRLLEAVWREGLWLINDGIATTTEIDDAIRYGFGLRWAQMGLFETYRVAGGEAGMAHFIAQFGPALEWPWTKLMDVPELTEDLIEKIASQSDAQSGQYSIRQLERIKDNNLVAMMRGLKTQNWGAGELLNQVDQQLLDSNLSKTPSGQSKHQGWRTVDRVIPTDWTDYNDHMNESRYAQVFSDAADGFLRLIGVDAQYVAAGFSYFTVDTHIRYLNECRAGERIVVNTKVLFAEGKKLQLYHEMCNAEGEVVCNGEQYLLHVDLNTRRSCAPNEVLAQQLQQLAENMQA